jgi:hypothetical protein
MDTHTRPIAERIDWLFALAARYAATYASPEAWLARQRYVALHPTDIMVLKCMDGRINIPVATHTPTGIIAPFRNLGGMFNLGWPHLGEVLAHHVLDKVSQGRQVLVLVTYHYSRGEPKRGCAGVGYDTAAAQAHTHGIREQLAHTFGRAQQTVYPMVCGFETDEDALVLHGAGGATLHIADLRDDDRATLGPRLGALLPDMPERMRADLIPLILGNMDRISEVRRAPRALDIEHREWMICIGRGFDFMHMPNLALIIGPYSPDLADPVQKAAGIIKENMRAGRIPADGFLLLASAPFEEIGVDRARAELKARFMSRFAAGVIADSQPDLATKMHVRTAVLDWRTRKLEILAEE